ncbi:demethylmenaquinone methyltransferase [Gluconobacter oxydans]|nr:demethylmenaquinone methyltransferase [Gluconobacter oxydans]
MPHDKKHCELRMTDHRPEKIPPHPVLSAWYDDSARRSGFVQSLFDRTAPYYDRINTIFSLGSGRWFRRRMLRQTGLQAGDRVLDIATGTGLVAREAAGIAGASNVVGLDMSAGMLAECRRNVPGVSLVQADAQRLPFSDGQFDLLSMGYALRHVADLRETFSVWRHALRPGGHVLILEIGRARSVMIQKILRLYLGRIVPFLSGVTATRDSRTLMEYYWDTIAQCVSPEEIRKALSDAGFENVQQQTYFGVFHAYTGRRPKY